MPESNKHYYSKYNLFNNKVFLIALSLIVISGGISFGTWIDKQQFLSQKQSSARGTECGGQYGSCPRGYNCVRGNCEREPGNQVQPVDCRQEDCASGEICVVTD